MLRWRLIQQMAAALGDGPSNLATIATCNLDQWALDWDGNLRRIEESIRCAPTRTIN